MPLINLDFFLDGQKLDRQIKIEKDHQKGILLLNKLRKTRLTIILCFSFAIIVLLTLVAILISSYPYIPSKVYSSFIISSYFAALPFFYKYNGNDYLLRFLALAGGLFAVTSRSVATHGIDSATFFWFSLIPLCSALILEKKMIYWSLAVSIVLSFIIFKGESLGFSLGPTPPPYANFFSFIGASFLLQVLPPSPLVVSQTILMIN